MGWAEVGYTRPADDDQEITDAQVRELRRLCEKKDGKPAGSYDELTWEITRPEASRRITQLKQRLGEQEKGACR